MGRLKNILNPTCCEYFLIANFSIACLHFATCWLNAVMLLLHVDDAFAK